LLLPGLHFIRGGGKEGGGRGKEKEKEEPVWHMSPALFPLEGGVGKEGGGRGRGKGGGRGKQEAGEAFDVR